MSARPNDKYEFLYGETQEKCKNGWATCKGDNIGLDGTSRSSSSPQR